MMVTAGIVFGISFVLGVFVGGIYVAIEIGQGD